MGFTAAACLLLVTSAWAMLTPPVTFTVNSEFDFWDEAPGDGSCADAVGSCTLRAAVMEANHTAGEVTIVLPAGTYKLIGPIGSIASEFSGDLNLTTPASGNPLITISGAGAASTIIDADAKDGVISVEAGRTAIIEDVTLRNGHAIGFGGGIHNEGVLTLRRVVVRDNHLSGAYAGGGIYNANQLGVYNSTISTNSTETGYGGGISNVGGLTVVNSAIHGNQAFSGAALFSAGAPAVVVIINSTFSANQALRDGGGIYNGSGATGNIYNATIAYNEADADANTVGNGAGVYNDASSTLNLRNSVVAENYLAGQQSYDDCTGTIGMYGNNRFSPTVDCSIAAGSPGTATQLDSLYEIGTLSDNGGPTLTIPLVSSSSMVGGGVACNDQNSVHLATDQRGRPRPPTFAPPVSTCDIGAFEYNEIFAGGFELP